MNKEIKKQLNILKDITIDSSFKKQNEEALLSYVSSNEVKSETTRFNFFVLWLRDFSKAISQPAFSVLAFVLILVTGTVLIQPFKSAMPNDALYIARVISEKAQINITFNNESRSKLAAKIANDHAKDIATMLTDPEIKNDQVAVAKLNESFKKEINTVKENLTKINRTTNTTTGQEATSTDEDVTFFVVGTEKEDNGLEVYANENQNSGIQENNEVNLSPDARGVAEIPEENVQATSKEDITETATSTETLPNDNNKDGDSHEEALDEVQNLFDQFKYEEALEGLNKIDELISQGEKEEEARIEEDIESAS